MSQFVDKFVGNIDDFGMDTISFAGSLEAKLKGRLRMFLDLPGHQGRPTRVVPKAGKRPLRLSKPAVYG